jgi:hypothetical protein
MLFAKSFPWLLSSMTEEEVVAKIKEADHAELGSAARSQQEFARGAS